MRQIAVLAALISLSACSAIPHRPPQTSGELESGYTYVPLDPFPVATVAGDSCKEKGLEQFDYTNAGLLKDLPDNTVRMMVEKLDTSGKVTFGPAKVGMIGERYNVTVDFINADTVNVPMWILKTMQLVDGPRIQVRMYDSNPGPRFVPGSELYEATKTPSVRAADNDFIFEEFNLPVYVGVGLRARADVTVTGGDANLTGIGVIGAEAEAQRVRGNLVVQTMGITGKSVSAALPIQSELNRTTAQNAIVAVASIKTQLYSEETGVGVRVLGFYLPFPGGKPLVNALISQISKSPRTEWPRPCRSTPVAKSVVKART